MGMRYWYRLVDVDVQGIETWHRPVSVVVLSTTPILGQNRPNPVEELTTINYSLPVDCDARLTVHNLHGRVVATLMDGRQKAGYRRIQWDATGYPSGAYVYKLTAGDRVFTKRLTVVK